jgi:hypothetical protein
MDTDVMNTAKRSKFNKMALETLISLAELHANDRHAGAFVILYADSRYAIRFGEDVEDGWLGADTYTSLKQALVEVLVNLELY